METQGGLTAVIRATIACDKACLKKLVSHGADVNYFNKVGPGKGTVSGHAQTASMRHRNKLALGSDFFSI